MTTALIIWWLRMMNKNNTMDNEMKKEGKLRTQRCCLTDDYYYDLTGHVMQYHETS